MYTRSRLTNKIYFNGVEVPQDDTTQMFQDYLTHILNNGVVEYVDSLPEEIAEERNKKAVEIDLEYTERIAKLMAKHNDKFIEGLTNGVPYTIPQDVLIEKQRLKDECNQLIADLGVTDYSYRQNNLQLKK
jgi:hypothetical protein